LNTTVKGVSRRIGIWNSLAQDVKMLQSGWRCSVIPSGQVCWILPKIGGMAKLFSGLPDDIENVKMEIILGMLFVRGLLGRSSMLC
jgi:hypothetical protein